MKKTRKEMKAMAKQRKSINSMGKSQHNTSLFSPQQRMAIDADNIEKTLAETTRLNARYITLDKLVDNTANPFKVKGTYYLEKSIKKLGQLQPIIILTLQNEDGKPSGKYEIKAGSRRFKAITNIHNSAIDEGNEKVAERFSQVWCTVLPLGTTEQEIQEVIVETNAYNRKIELDELFSCFDIIFEKDDEGNYVSFNPKKEKIEQIQYAFKDMGYSFGRTAIKQYYKIYNGHPMLRQYYEKEYISKSEALIVSDMPLEMQKNVLEKSNKMTDKEFKAYLKTFKESKPKKVSRMKGFEAIKNIDKIKKQVQQMDGIKITVDENERKEILDSIQEIETVLNTLKSKIAD